MADDREPIAAKRWLAFVMAEISIITALAVLVIWITKHPGPIDNDKYNWHAILMSFGFCGFMFNAIMSFKMFKGSHGCQKGVHAVLHTLTFGCVTAGVILMFQFHATGIPGHPIPDLYSVHSIVGLFTLVCFGVQWLMGAGSFLLGAPQSFREWAAPYHRFFGAATLGFTTAAMVLGAMDRQRLDFEVPFPPDPNYNMPDDKFANAYACAVLVAAMFTCLVLHNATKSDEVRRADRESQLSRGEYATFRGDP